MEAVWERGMEALSLGIYAQDCERHVCMSAGQTGDNYKLSGRIL